MKIFKKAISIILSAFLITFPVFASDSENVSDQRVATEYMSDDLYDPLDEIPEDVQTVAQAPELIAKSAILMDTTTGKIMYENNSHEKLPPASITKIMTLLLVMEAIEQGKITLEDNVTTSEHAASMGGSQIWLEPGETMTLKELLKATCVASANDASVALGEYIAGSEETFVSLMNERAKQLGMNDTTFMNATGLDAEGHLTSANDIAVMSRELIRHELIKEYSTIWMDSLRGGETQLVNTNRLVRFYEGATGLKTGTTSGAGSCLSATAERNGLSLIAVVMGSPTSNDRFNSARKLLDYGFANWAMHTPKLKTEGVGPVQVKNGVLDEVSITPPAPTPVLIPKGRGADIVEELDIVKEIQAPIEKGQALGRIILKLDDKVIAEYVLGAEKDVDRMTFSKALKLLFESMISL